MLQFDVNISILLKEVPFLERFERAAQLNFGAVEFWWPGEENLVAIGQRVQATGLRVALMNFDSGNMAGGERGFLNDPARQQWVRSHVPQALYFAATIGCPLLNALVGNNSPGESREAQMYLERENFFCSADRAARTGLGFVVV